MKGSHPTGEAEPAEARRMLAMVTFVIEAVEARR
jgi:hypothetical protein